MPHDLHTAVDVPTSPHIGVAAVGRRHPFSHAADGCEARAPDPDCRVATGTSYLQELTLTSHRQSTQHCFPSIKHHRVFLAAEVLSLGQCCPQVMQRVLNTMVPRFLAQLRADYALWASGDESRKPVGTGQL